MKTWEYMVLEGHSTGIVKELNKLGAVDGRL